MSEIAKNSDIAEYSLAVLPGSDAKIVKIEKGRLLGAIDLEALVDDLGRLGNCVRIAYHGVAGFTDLQIEVQRVGYDVTRLCDKSAITVGKFKNASSTVLSSLQATYEYLLGGFEDMALDTLSDVADTAKEMAVAAKQLHDDFEYQSEKVIATLEKTQTTAGSEEQKKRDIIKMKKDFEEEKAKQDRLRQEAEKKASQAQQMFYISENKEIQAERGIEDLKNEQQRAQANESGFWSSLGRLFSSRCTQSTNYSLLISAKMDAAQDARKVKIQQLQRLNEQQDLRSKALAELERYAQKISNLKEDESQVDISIEALYNAIGALKSLAAVMLQAARFWEQLQDHCEMLAKGEIKKEIERALKYPEERRLKFWKSKGFMGKAVRYYAGWVALDDVCLIYMERIKLTQRELYTYIQEALPPEAARKKVKELATFFTADLKQQQNAIAERKLQHNKEIEGYQEEAKKAAEKDDEDKK